ncbi:MAG: flagellin [Butyrivibrio sp.]|nr:flagellin [Muribaculum sp.]MCM1089562.1 flagellin [Muribaculum sp.]MCM1551361.1 flagellin [Butyrivibrio sp.]MCM1551364.1 flagellin [Butyrivibrio sp.]
MIVKHNLTAMNSNRMLGLTTATQAKSTEKLSSGYKVNRAADDASGLAISEKMRRQVRGLTQASANAQDGISMVQTAEGALNEVHDMLQRLNELAVKGENGTLTTEDRSYINSEVKQLMSEIDRVASTTTFNEKNLLNGDCSSGVDLQVGAESGQHIQVKIKKMNCSGLSLSGTTSTASAAGTLNATVKAAIKKLNEQRSELGAVQNRLEHTINNLDNIAENTQSAESAIRDTDMALEMVTYANNNILAQAGQSMLAQANQANQGVLSLLG